MAELIDAATMRSIVAIDESAMPSTCVVFARSKAQTSRGGTSAAVTETARNATPLPCRVVPGGTALQSQMVAERLKDKSDVTVQISVTAIKLLGVPFVVDDDDVIEVLTPVRLTDGSNKVVTERYKVTGVPSTGSYATNMPVTCSFTE